MDMIMQTDGTMKLETRRGEKNYIVASAGYGRKKGKDPAKKQGDLIYAVDDEKARSRKEVTEPRVFAYHRTGDR